MKKILASIAAIAAISALSIAVSAEGGLGDASFDDAEATTIGVQTLPAVLETTVEAAQTVGEDTNTYDTAEVGQAEATVDENGETAGTVNDNSFVQAGAGNNAASASVISASVEGNKVSSGVAETIVPVLAVAGAVAFVVSRKKK